MKCDYLSLWIIVCVSVDLIFFFFFFFFFSFFFLFFFFPCNSDGDLCTHLAAVMVSLPAALECSLHMPGLLCFAPRYYISPPFPFIKAPDKPVQGQLLS